MLIDIMKNGSLKTDIYLWKSKNIPGAQEKLQQNGDTTPGTEQDNQRFIKMMESIRFKTEIRPRPRPLEVLADSVYDDVTIAKSLRSRAIKSNIPNNTRNSKRRKRGIPTRFDEETYHYRGYRKILCIFENGI
jgi:hypothetical protein